MKMFLMQLEKCLYLLKEVPYPDIWLLASKVSQKQLDMVLSYSDNVVVEYDVNRSFIGDFIRYPFDVIDGSIDVSFFGGKFFARKKGQLILKDIAIEAPYPYIIKKTPYQDLTNLLQKNTFNIYGVRFSNTLQYLFTKDLHFHINPVNKHVIFTKTAVTRIKEHDLHYRALRNLETLMNIRLQHLGNSCIVGL